MRILHVLATGMHGGAATAALTLARSQREWEEVAFALPRRHTLDREVQSLETAGVEVLPLDLKFQRSLGGWLRYLQVLRTRRFDVAHVHLPDPITGVWPTIGARCAGTPLVVDNEHHPMAIPPERWTWKQRLARRMMQRMVHRFLAETMYSASYLQDYCGVAESRVSVLHLGIDRAAFESSPSKLAAREALGMAAVAPVVSIVGNLIDERKGHHVLFEAVATMVKSLPDLRLCVIGDGPRKLEFQQDAARLGIAENCVFLGRTSFEQLVAHLAASDVLAMPSLDEGFGLVALEAMAVGLPPVVSAVGGLLDIVEDGKTGLLVPAGDASALACALMRLLENPVLAEALGSAGRQAVAERWDASKLAERQIALYREWLNPRGAPATA